MRKRSIILVTLALTLMAASCQKWKIARITEPGISNELADLRKTTITNLNYDMRFEISENADEDISSEILISFDFNRLGDYPFVVDFNEKAEMLHSV